MRWVLIPVTARASAASGIMNDEMLMVSQATHGAWHRAQRELIPFEATCWFTDLHGGCQYNISQTEAWQEPRSYEFEALMEFYMLMGGDNWRANDNWGVMDPCWDGWYGIECNADGYVITIALNDNNLRGSLQSWRQLGELKQLRRFAVHNSGRNFHGNTVEYANVIQGPLPSFARNSELRVLDLGDNYFDAFPADLYLNTKLETLSAPRCRFTELPRYMHVFTELRTLDLQRNMIADPLPSTLGAMINLRQVNLAFNELTGSVNSGMKKMTKCQTFDIQGNGGVEGEFPLIAPFWPDVEYVSIKGTSMTGIMMSLCSDVEYCFKFMFDTHLDMTWVTDGGVSDQIVATLQLAVPADDR
jgi:hypothetical protein